MRQRRTQVEGSAQYFESWQMGRHPTRKGHLLRTSNNSHVEAMPAGPPWASVQHSFEDPSSFLTPTSKFPQEASPTESPSSVPWELWYLGSKATCPGSWASGQGPGVGEEGFLVGPPTPTTTLS
ncbi:hypothetical protein H1C71_018925 [Ictidomys tridecemlineatus]|nr:hypothetical protein H1C71_018925 [Ictidomys tridecemlineatus]